MAQRSEKINFMSINFHLNSNMWLVATIVEGKLDENGAMTSSPSYHQRLEQSLNIVSIKKYIRNE